MTSTTPTTFVLPAELGVMTAGKLAAELAQRRGAPIALDASTISFVGGLCVQILLAARDAWRAAGDSFELADPSAACCSDLRLLGVASEFGVCAEEAACP